MVIQIGLDPVILLSLLGITLAMEKRHGADTAVSWYTAACLRVFKLIRITKARQELE